MWNNLSNGYKLILLCMATSYVITFVKDSALLKTLRAKLSTRSSLCKELLKCSFCLAFWVATITILFIPPVLVVILAIAYASHIIYKLVEKFLPCDECKLSKDEVAIMQKSKNIYKMGD